MGRTVFTFDTTHHALWAEEIARDRQIAHEIVPAPPGSHARCDIAIETLAEGVPALASGLGDAGVEFRLFKAPA